MTTAVIPGSFDPVTVGHLDIIQRTTRFADRVVVAVGTNRAKTPQFSQGIRVRMLETACADLSRVEICSFEGPLIDLCQRLKADMIVKGVRGADDIAWESSQAAVNRDMGAPETVWLPTRGDLFHVSSSVVRELLSWGMDVSRYVPDPVIALMRDNNGKESSASLGKI